MNDVGEELTQLRSGGLGRGAMKFVFHLGLRSVGDETHRERAHARIKRSDAGLGLDAHADARAASVCHALLVVPATLEVWTVPEDVSSCDDRETFGSTGDDRREVLRADRVLRILELAEEERHLLTEV